MALPLISEVRLPLFVIVAETPIFNAISCKSFANEGEQVNALVLVYLLFSTCPSPLINHSKNF